MINGNDLMGNCQRLYREALAEWGSVSQVSHWETNIQTFMEFWHEQGGFPITLLNITVKYRNHPAGTIILVSTHQNRLVLNPDGTITNNPK